MELNFITETRLLARSIKFYFFWNKALTDISIEIRELHNWYPYTYKHVDDAASAVFVPALCVITCTVGFGFISVFWQVYKILYRHKGKVKLSLCLSI
jgi:hypothetical protein